MNKPNKQQLRVAETRAKLLDAAAHVFLRDGYEKAQLDDIAALAARSKGAVYTHFKSKEDLYLALFEQRRDAYFDQFTNLISDCSTRKESIKAYRKFYLSVVADRSWHMISLDFKLFALRHPESREHFRRVQNVIATYEKGRPSLAKLLFSSSRAQSEQDKLAIIALSHIMSGLVLESHFEPKVLSAKVLHRFLGNIFDALFPAPDNVCSSHEGRNAQGSKAPQPQTGPGAILSASESPKGRRLHTGKTPLTVRSK